MARTIAAVVVGYLVLGVLIFVTFTAAYFAMGADRAFLPGTYDASVLWLVTSFLLGFLAAVIGGWVCAKIARNSRATKVLAVVVIVLGLAMAVPTLTAPESSKPGPRTGDVSNLDAMMKAQQPNWVVLVTPFLGAVGVLLGSPRRSGGYMT